MQTKKMDQVQSAIASASAEDCKCIELWLKQRRAALRGPKPPLNLSKVKERVDWSRCSDGYDIEWQRHVVDQILVQAHSSFDELFHELVPEFDAMTNLTAARSFTTALRKRIDGAMEEELRAIKAGLPKSNIAILWNAQTDRYQAVSRTQ
jgi:hypothetical protein